MVDDDRFDQLVDMSLAGDLVVAVGDGHESGSEADSQVVWVHHVLLTVLGQAVDETRSGQSYEVMVPITSGLRIIHLVPVLSWIYLLEFNELLIYMYQLHLSKSNI